MKTKQSLHMHAADTQTLHELQILPSNNKEGSILNFFDQTKTQGGQDLLRKLIAKPKTSEAQITSFQNLLQFIGTHAEAWKLDVSRAYIAAAESYYASNIAHTMSQDVFKHWVDTLLYAWRNPAEFYLIQSGLTATLLLVRGMRGLTERFAEITMPGQVEDDFLFLRRFLLSDGIDSFLKTKNNRLSLRSVFYRDYYFRVKHRKSFRRLLDICYSFDAYLAIVKTQQLHALTFPEFAKGEAVFDAEKIWHPLIPNAVPNNFAIRKASVCLVSGANTSGKTTFLKTCGLVVYLAHLGWPVPAQKLRLSFSDKLFTSIHLSDNLALGYSHFYNEIMRIKAIALALHAGDRCFVIIDELFRGTNQEDAFHCSKTVLDGFAAHHNASFLVSTHLYDLMESYRSVPSISFHCFKTKIIRGDFENTFQIEEGIASEKIGQLILGKVGITELLKKNL